MTTDMEPKVHPFFETNTCSWQYVVACPERKEAAIIDPVLNYDPANFVITTESAGELMECAPKNYMQSLYC